MVVDPDKMTQPAEVAAEIVTDALWELIGQDIVRVEESPDNPNDPIFNISGDHVIEVEADTDLDPWVLTLPDIVYVGTMSSPPAYPVEVKTPAKIEEPSKRVEAEME